MTPRRRIVFFLHDGGELIDFAGPAAVLGRAHDDSGVLAYEVIVVSRLGASVRTAEGVSIVVDALAHTVVDRFDTLVVPGGFEVDSVADDRASLHEIRRLAGLARRTVSVCSGALLLAAAGLLDGKAATTHWSALRRLQTEHPLVDTRDAVVWVRDGNTYTSAGATTGVDLAFELVNEDLGPRAAARLAKWMVVFVRRPGDQSQRSVRLALPEPATPQLRRVVDRLVDDPAQEVAIGELAASVGLSTRHFSRLFAAEFGMTPARFVERLRVETATHHLVTSNATVDQIATAAGFGSAETMRRAFLRVRGSAPSDVRRQLRSLAGDGPVSDARTAGA